MHLDFSDAFTERTPRVVAAAKLLRPAGRKKAQRFLAEGENAVEAAVRRGVATDIFVTESANARHAGIVNTAASLGVYVHPVTDRAAKKLADTVSGTGIIAVCTPIVTRVDAFSEAPAPTLVSIPVDTSEPGNAGTLIRVADATGADHVLFAGDTVDPLNPKVVRSSAGSLFNVPVTREPNIPKVLDAVREKGLQIVATTAEGETSLDDAQEVLAQPTAWLFGNEAHGLHEKLIEQADVRIRIPLRGRAESLNLATAAAICMYESSKALNS
ncbi:RNA methyltransferase [Corynebacterium sp. TAE3-ERU30]|uniref:TrmH family RNA methyltransferase n=1 Tax=Corynebacterium sp. TAE3-ERU30 TaxID=2849496 RepID=UPI001C47EA7A|nr:RNA methyltransferase [Corynebacterium sp. TAE3-ERU30]MBV7281406.1 RNA methyltransferase [Corynebacterium sp. TAE3-ERU30]